MMYVDALKHLILIISCGFTVDAYRTYRLPV